MLRPSEMPVVKRFLILFTSTVLCLPVLADVRLPRLFGDHMILQQETANAVWGWADPGESVSVTASWGETAKAARVVPLKAALTLAAGRALVTRDGPAAREGLGDDAVLVPAADPDALAAALRELAADRERTRDLAARGRERFLARYTPVRAAAALVEGIASRDMVPESPD